MSKVNNFEIIDRYMNSKQCQRSTVKTSVGCFFINEVAPTNPFKRPFEQLFIETPIRDNAHNRNVVESYKGYIDPDIYTENGYGLPVFSSVDIKTNGFHEIIDFAIDFIKNTNLEK